MEARSRESPSVRSRSNPAGHGSPSVSVRVRLGSILFAQTRRGTSSAEQASAAFETGRRLSLGSACFCDRSTGIVTRLWHVSRECCCCCGIRCGCHCLNVGRFRWLSESNPIILTKRSKILEETFPKISRSTEFERKLRFNERLIFFYRRTQECRNFPITFLTHSIFTYCINNSNTPRQLYTKAIRFTPSNLGFHFALVYLFSRPSKIHGKVCSIREWSTLNTEV